MIDNSISLDDDNADLLNWRKCGDNIFQLIRTFNLNAEEYLRTLIHNMSAIDTLTNGDVVKMEGYKIMDSLVLYHHTALVTGSL